MQTGRKYRRGLNLWSSCGVFSVLFRQSTVPISPEFSSVRPFATCVYKKQRLTNFKPTDLNAGRDSEGLYLPKGFLLSFELRPASRPRIRNCQGLPMRCSIFFVPVMLFTMHLDAIAQEKQKAMQPFRSELWQREFRTDDKEDEKKENSPDQEDEDSDSPSAKARKAQKVSSPGEKIPGQLGLEELRDSTPIAEWQVDSAAEREAGNTAFRNEASAWHLSHATKDVDATTEMAQGPTITTYLVGFMACIVVAGALLTGRE